MSNKLLTKPTELMDFYDATYIAVLCQLKLTVIKLL